MFTFTIARSLPETAIVGLQPKSLLRRFATLAIAIAAFLALERMPHRATVGGVRPSTDCRGLGDWI